MSKVASRAFGIDLTEAIGLVNSGRRIHCRPDQFARFLIWRSEVVSINQFQALDAKLVAVKPVPTFVDVQAN